ncbi:MAG: hypothetical protein NZ583_03555 [Desulfobacterota bacterium]|nr:hypothetical protein [Thermodesulfobacteriota bacterium]MDW8001963.1 hypothetical protein [Deltaproteobacteria bacterium]
MAGILIRSVQKGELVSDIRETARRLHHFPKVLVAEREEIKNAIMKIYSSLFPEENLILVLVDPQRDTLKVLKDQIDEVSKKIWVVIYEVKEDDRTISKRADETERDLKKSVLSFLKKHQKTMTDKAFLLFTRRVGNSDFLEAELMKLVNYVGERTEIKSKDVERIVTSSDEADVSRLFDAIKGGDRKEATKVLNGLLDRGLAPLIVSSYLSRILRLLLQAKDFSHLLDPYNSESSFMRKFYGIKQTYPVPSEDKKNYFLSLNPRHAMNIAAFASRVSLIRLKDLLRSLGTYDLKLKTGTKFERTLLELILLRGFDV